MLHVVDASGRDVTLGRGFVARPAADDAGTLLATDTLRRTAQVLGLRARAVAVPPGWEALNVPASPEDGPADVALLRPAEVAGPPYGPAHRLAWLAGDALADAEHELTSWRARVAAWAEEPSKPMCAEVQQQLLAALADDLDTRTAVAALRGSLSLDLPPGCLFETWAWADRLLALDLASEVGR